MSLTESAIAFDGLEFRARARVAWGFFWRALVTCVAWGVVASIAAFILGFICGYFARPLGYDPSSHGVILTAKIMGGVAGAIIGILLFWHYIRWLLRARFAGLKLVLIAERRNAV